MLLRDVGDWSPTRQKIWLSFSFVQRRRRGRSTPETASTGQIHDKSPRAGESSGEPSVRSRRKATMRSHLDTKSQRLSSIPRESRSGFHIGYPCGRDEKLWGYRGKALNDFR